MRAANRYCEYLKQPSRQARSASHEPEIRSDNSSSTIGLSQATYVLASQDEGIGQL